MPSFDIVSKISTQEIDNAVNQTRKEFESRYDLRTSQPEIKWDQKEIALTANEEAKLVVMKDILQGKMFKRGIPLESLKFDKVEPIGGRLMRQKVTIEQGIKTEKAKEINKAIKESKLKVQTQIQGETIKVTSKSRDELQACMAFVKSANLKIALQFENLRQ